MTINFQTPRLPEQEVREVSLEVLHKRIDLLRTSLARFEFFLRFIEACREAENEPPLDPTQIVVSYYGGAGFDWLTVQDFLNAREAIRELDKPLPLSSQAP